MQLNQAGAFEQQTTAHSAREETTAHRAREQTTAPSARPHESQDSSALALLARVLTAQPTRTGVKVSKLEYTIGNAKGPHIFAEWTTDLRNYAAAKYPAHGTDVVEAALQQAHATHKVWLDTAPLARSTVMPELRELEGAQRTVSEQIATDVSAAMPRAIADWANRTATTAKRGRRLVDLLFKALCTIMPRSFESRDAAREAMQVAGNIRAAHLETWLIDWRDQLERLEDVNIFEVDCDNYSGCFKALKKTVDGASVNGEFTHALRSFMLHNPQPNSKINRTYLFMYWETVYALASTYYPAELAPESKKEVAKDKANVAKGGGKGGGKKKEDDGKSPVACRLHKEGKCTWGDKCRFSHGKDDDKKKDNKKKDAGKGAGKDKDKDKGERPKSEKPCYNWQNTGTCKFGDKCIFKHEKGAPKPGGGAPPAGGGGAR